MIAEDMPTERRDEPFFSIIVPVFKQWSYVRSLFRAIEEQTMSRSDFEVIIVNNGDHDEVPQFVRSGLHRIIHCSQPGSYNARNAGAAVAQGDWLVFTDADCMPQRQWLEELRSHATANAKMLLAGEIEVVSRTKSPNASEVYDLVKGIPQERYVSQGFGATANLAIAASIFKSLEGFDGTRFSGGDAEFCRRAGRASYPIMFVPTAVVEHPARKTWTEIVVKTRRIKGGQLRRSSAWYHRSLLSTALPPVRAFFFFLMNDRHSLRRRITACGVHLVLWGVELVEAARLLAKRTPERR